MTNTNHQPSNKIVEILNIVVKPIFCAANLWQIQKMAKTNYSRRKLRLSIY